MGAAGRRRNRCGSPAPPARIPAVARLLRGVARLPQGRVVLPGLDLGAAGGGWEAAGELASAGRAARPAGRSRRRPAARWTPGTARARRPRAGRARSPQALLPAPALAAWRGAAGAGHHRPAPAGGRGRAGGSGRHRADPARCAGDARHARAALVTPDRALAGRVAARTAALGRGGRRQRRRAAGQTPPAVFLRLLAQAVADAAGAGAAAGAAEASAGRGRLAAGRVPRGARALETRRAARAAAAGRGCPDCAAPSREPPEHARPSSSRLNAIASRRCSGARAAVSASPADALAALSRRPRRWQRPRRHARPRAAVGAGGRRGAGRPARRRAAGARATARRSRRRRCPDCSTRCWRGQVVRSRRALRGRGAGAEHPRIFIWGLLEARLQSVEVAVLGGLVEGVWPPATDPGPWLSRPMRRAPGCRAPRKPSARRRTISLLAACAAPQAVLSCPRRRDGAPAVPARWLVRLDAFLPGRGRGWHRIRPPAWARRLDQPARRPAALAPHPAAPARRRAPAPAARDRDRDDGSPIRTASTPATCCAWRPLNPLEQATDAADYGSAGARGDASVLTAARHDLAARRARAAARRHGHARSAKPGRCAPRSPNGGRRGLHRIADWVAERGEPTRRSVAAPAKVAVEIGGEWSLEVPRGFLLRGRADRIERRADGRLAILDYKTGTMPAEAEVERGRRRNCCWKPRWPRPARSAPR